MDAYKLHIPSGRRVPILLSVPHCGTLFPNDMAAEFNEDLIRFPDDTDWFVDRLYSFASSLGVTMIAGVYHRWVIDLNRDPESKPLYSDGRIITDLCPLTTFLGQPLYADGRKTIDPNEVERRKSLFFRPYHNEIIQMLDDLRAEFGTVLLWDCHSIRQLVPTIQAEKFPDLILGSADNTSARAEIIGKALEVLASGTYSLEHNHPFKGGYITRMYGNPEKGLHALQLEMTKVNYMDEREIEYDREKAERLEELLYNTISSLAETLISAKDH